MECEFHGDVPTMGFTQGDYESERLCFRCYAEAQVLMTKQHQARLREGRDDGRGAAADLVAILLSPDEEE